MEINKIDLPKDFEKRMKLDLGEKFDRYLESLELPAVRGLRVNTNRISVSDFKKLSNLPLESVPYSNNGFILKSDEKIGNSFYHMSGLCYLQEPSSMIPVCASKIENEKGDLRVLDLCAAPGGKTGQIANLVSKNSLIFSNEIIGSRASALYSNIERQGFKNVVVLNEKPENLLIFENYFDYVFVDAPCSGEGMFRKNPETIDEWSAENVSMCAKRQKEILRLAEKLVKAGGKLVYSTCTYSKEEDEQIVDWFLNNFNYSIEEVNDEIKACTIPANLNGKVGENSRKFLPFTGKGEGQFVAVLKNLDEEIDRETKLYSKKHTRTVFEIGRSEKLIFKEWAIQNLKEDCAQQILKDNLLKVGDGLYLAPKNLGAKEVTALDELRFKSLGVKLGVFEKGRFEPDHSIFMACLDMLKIAIDINGNEAAKFIHGEQLETKIHGKGYVAICYNGYPLGGAKLAGGRLNNLLPKALRI